MSWTSLCRQPRVHNRKVMGEVSCPGGGKLLCPLKFERRVRECDVCLARQDEEIARTAARPQSVGCSHIDSVVLFIEHALLRPGEKERPDAAKEHAERIVEIGRASCRER